MQKRVTYNRANKDFDMFLNGDYIGSRERHIEAEVELDRLAYEALTHDGSDQAIPPAAAILVVAKEQRADAVRQHDAATVKVLDRVIVGVACGAQLRWVLGDLLVASVNNPGTEYTISCGRCNCPAFKPCWHLKVLDILLDMQDTAAGDADFEADADELAVMMAEEEDGPIIHLMLVAPARPLGLRRCLARKRYVEAA